MTCCTMLRCYRTFRAHRGTAIAPDACPNTREGTAAGCRGAGTLAFPERKPDGDWQTKLPPTAARLDRESRTPEMIMPDRLKDVCASNVGHLGAVCQPSRKPSCRCQSPLWARSGRDRSVTLVLGVFLAALGVGLLVAAAMRLQQPHALQSVDPLGLAIAIVALIAKEGMFRYMLAVAKRVRSQMLVANAWHARSDAASSLVVVVGILGAI